ncbi:hypothetical protein K1719_026410 [Acacia pycnantha]|nr:hypothetical protein K1719_026410 [Acacia pycnantha]
MVIAEDEWWERKIKENKEYRKYRYKDDVYRPQMDLQESSSDSEEWLQGTNTGGSVQVPADLEGMNLTSNTQPCAPSGSTSIGKRKRGWEGTAHDARVF